MKLSVLVPVYNEANTAGAVIENIKRLPINNEIVLVDDFSTDGTRQFLRQNYGDGKDNIKVFYHNVNLGKGAAVNTALRHANGEYTIIQDADLEYDPRDYLNLIACAEKNNASVIYGSRFYNNWRATSLPHFLVNKFLTTLTNLLFKAYLTDMETCYKLVKTEILKSLNLKSQKFEIEAEITAKLLKKGYKIFEVPISYRGRSYHEGKKINWRDGITTLWTLLKLRCIP